VDLEEKSLFTEEDGKKSTLDQQATYVCLLKANGSAIVFYRLYEKTSSG